jgi:K+-sensing histidine kinase KdpD
MIAMAVIVMGMKGRDYMLEMKNDDERRFKLYLKGYVIAGYYEIGWALILAIVASLISYISFGFFLLEYKDMTDMRQPRPTKV